MEAILALQDQCRVATAKDVVYNSECCYTFHTPYTSDQGIVVNLNTFMGTVQEMAMIHNVSNNPSLFVRIVKRRVLKPDPVSTADFPDKLAIGVEGGFRTEDDQYETIATYSLLVLKKGEEESAHLPPIVVAELPYSDQTKSTFPERVVQSVESIILHVGMSTQQDVKVWQLDADEPVPVTKYYDTIPFVDNGVVIDPDPTTWKCQKTGAADDNLWLNLSDGYIGGGRRHWDGSGGSNGAIDHYHDTHQQYPLVVKLGTITADLDTADCYSYAADEDGPVRIPNLAELLERRGIKVAAMQKTVKSTAELEVELNATYAFDAITEAGAQLTPVTGPGLQGLQNLGNSCYINSVLQMLLSGTVPELSRRYGTAPYGSITQHPFLTRVSAQDAPTDLLCQNTKVACALTSGIFAKPPTTAGDDSPAISTDDPKYRLAPRMFKYVIGRDHVDFRTGQQQDAAQFLQYYLERLDRAELALAKSQQADLVFSKNQPSSSHNHSTGGGGQVHTASHLFCFQTTSRLVCGADGRVKYKENAPETIFSVRLPMDKAVTAAEPTGAAANPSNSNTVTSPEHKRLKAVDDAAEDGLAMIPTLDFAACLDDWAADNTVEGIRWPHLGNVAHPAVQRTRFSNFPRYLLVQAQRYKLGPDWQPVKIEVNLNMPEELDFTHYRSTGPQADEQLVPDDDNNESTNNDTKMASSSTGAAAASSSSTAIIDESALAQLMDMGFSINGCKRALRAVGGSDVAAATTWVFEHNMDPDFNDPLPQEVASSTSSSAGGPPASVAAIDEDTVQTLVAALDCFTYDQVRAALRETNGEADRAADWLFSHMEDLDAAVAALESKYSPTGTTSAVETAPSSSSVGSVPLEDGEGRYCMVGMISHIGKNTGSGHYVAHLKKDGHWVIFNDEKVALSSEPPLKHAYLYLFQRTDTMGMPNDNY